MTPWCLAEMLASVLVRQKAGCTEKLAEVAEGSRRWGAGTTVLAKAREWGRIKREAENSVSSSGGSASFSNLSPAVVVL